MRRAARERFRINDQVTLEHESKDSLSRLGFVTLVGFPKGGLSGLENSRTPLGARHDGLTLEDHKELSAYGPVAADHSARSEPGCDQVNLAAVRDGRDCESAAVELRDWVAG